MKKLLIITDMYPDAHNPVNGVFVEQQVRALSKYYQIRVVATAFSYPSRQTESVENDVSICRIDYSVSKISHLLSVFGYYKYCLPKIKEVLRSFNPDIIHIHDCRHIPELLCLRMLLKPYHMKKIVTLHNVRTKPALISNGLTAKLYHLSLKISLKDWTQIFTVNAGLRDLVLSYNRKMAVKVIGNAIAPGTASENQDKADMLLSWLDEDMGSDRAFRIISVGNLVATKGFDILLKALKIVKDAGYNSQLMIVGEGEERGTLTSLAKDLCLDGNVHFTGSLPNASVRQLYQSFDAFVLPSWRETFGIVYLEAMEVGLVTVGVMGQGIDGVIRDGVNGLLVPPGDEVALARKLLEVIENPERFQDIRDKAKETVQDAFMMDGLVGKIREVYDAR